MSRGGTCIGMHIVKGCRKCTTNCIYSFDGACNNLGGFSTWGRCNICKYKETKLTNFKIKEPDRTKKKDSGQSLNAKKLLDSTKKSKNINSMHEKTIKDKNKKINIASLEDELGFDSLNEISECNKKEIIVNGELFAVGDLIIFKNEEYRIRKIIPGSNYVEILSSHNINRYISLEMNVIAHKPN